MDLQAALCSYLLSVSSLHGSLQAIDWSHVSLPLDQPLNFFMEDEQSVSHIDRFAFTSRDSVNDIISCFLFHKDVPSPLFINPHLISRITHHRE